MFLLRFTRASGSLMCTFRARSVKWVGHGRLAAGAGQKGLKKGPAGLPAAACPAGVSNTDTLCRDDNHAKEKGKGPHPDQGLPGLVQGVRLVCCVLPLGSLQAQRSGKAEVVRESECINCEFCELHCPDFAIMISPRDESERAAETPKPRLASDRGRAGRGGIFSPVNRSLQPAHTLLQIRDQGHGQEEKTDRGFRPGQ